MAGHDNAVGNVPFVKTAFDSNVALGEKANASEFIFVIRGHENLEHLVRNIPIPEMGRDPVEDFGQHGQKFQQQSPISRSGEAPITFVETLTGTVLQAIRESEEKKAYFDCYLSVAGESNGGSASSSMVAEFLHCWIKLDNTDLGTEDVAVLVKPTGTLYYNWVEDLR